MLSTAVNISIHASAKEATLLLIWFFLSFPISIHASAKEATAKTTYNFYKTLRKVVAFVYFLIFITVLSFL